MSELLVREDTGIVTITLNRPDRLNAISRSLAVGLRSALAKLSRSSARIVVVRGAGKSFCAGADLKELAHVEATSEDLVDLADVLQDVTRLVMGSPKVFIAAIHGWCVGGGLELALACDLRICADSGRFYFGESRAGVTITGGASYLLPLLVGLGRAKRMVLCAEAVGAEEAMTAGMVDCLVPESELDRKIEEVIAAVQRTAPLSASAHKRLFLLGPQIGLEAALVLERESNHAIATSADAVEGARAFSEKREPRFTGG